jgi:hypothetical protein
MEKGDASKDPGIHWANKIKDLKEGNENKIVDKVLEEKVKIEKNFWH